MYYPVTCVDNFYSNPNKVREFALSLEYTKEEKYLYPGKRSKPLHEVDMNFFNMFTKKVLSLFHNLNPALPPVNCIIESQFQIIEPGAYEKINEGWVHSDKDIMSGIIYLTPDMSLDCGTTLYRPKKEHSYTLPINSEWKRDQYLNYKKDNEDIYLEKLRENNNMFEEVIKFSNVYNRLITYDSFYFHKESKFFSKNKTPRLTQVFFIHNVFTDNFPIPSSRRFDIV